jgi:hypothetical protein
MHNLPLSMQISQFVEPSRAGGQRAPRAQLLNWRLEASVPGNLRMQRKTTLLIVATSCAVAGLGAWAFLRGQGGIQYRTATVEHGDINVAISATGSPNAVVTVQVGSQVSGAILALYADFNT